MRAAVGRAVDSLAVVVAEADAVVVWAALVVEAADYSPAVGNYPDLGADNWVVEAAVVVAVDAAAVVSAARAVGSCCYREADSCSNFGVDNFGYLDTADGHCENPVVEPEVDST